MGPAVLELKHGSLCSSLVNIFHYIMTWISPLVSDEMLIADDIIRSIVLVFELGI